MSYECWRAEVALGRMADWDEDRGNYVGGSGGGPRVWTCVACEKKRWEDDCVQVGAYQTVYCVDCDPFAGDDHCDGCGYDAASCACDRRIP